MIEPNMILNQIKTVSKETFAYNGPAQIRQSNDGIIEVQTATQGLLAASSENHSASQTASFGLPSQGESVRI